MPTCTPAAGAAGPKNDAADRTARPRAGEAQVAVGGSCEIVEQLVPVIGRQVVVDGDDRPVAIVGVRRRDGGAHRGHRVPAGGRPVVGDHEGRTLGERHRVDAVGDTRGTGVGDGTLVLRVLVVVAGHALGRGHRAVVVIGPPRSWFGGDEVDQLLDRAHERLLELVPARTPRRGSGARTRAGRRRRARRTCRSSSRCPSAPSATRRCRPRPVAPPATRRRRACR